MSQLNRFLQAQENIYSTALAELQRGVKETHWMWFIFPQVDGLGISSTAKYYAIKNRAEAEEYLGHPILGSRLLECTSTLLTIRGRTAYQIFGSPDDLKLRSSMTLFSATSPADSLFHQVLSKYYSGQPDPRTIEILQSS